MTKQRHPSQHKKKKSKGTKKTIESRKIINADVKETVKYSFESSLSIGRLFPNSIVLNLTFDIVFNS